MLSIMATVRVLGGEGGDWSHAEESMHITQEAMRLQPVVANNLRRVVVRPVRLSNGFVLPAGVHVELAQYSVMRNPAWGWEAPYSFKPVSQEQTHGPVHCHPQAAPDLHPEWYSPGNFAKEEQQTWSWP